MSVIRDDADVALYAQAAEHFPDDRHHQDVRGGVTLVYVDGETVITKLNETFGLFGWQFEVLADGIYDDDEAWCRGRLTIYKRLTLAQGTDDEGNVSTYREVVHTVAREQYGSQKIKRSRSNGRPLDIGFDKKGAATDCLKKCASLVGIALYLWNKEEAAMVKWALANARTVDSTSTNVPPEDDGRPALPRGSAQNGNGQASGGMRRPNRAPANPGSGTGGPVMVINGKRMPVGFEAPFVMVGTDKSRWQCRAEGCEATVEAESTYRVGSEEKLGQYVLDRAREEAGAVLCVTHMAAWYRAKQIATGAPAV